MDFQISGSENSRLRFKVSPACRTPLWPSRPPQKKPRKMKNLWISCGTLKVCNLKRKQYYFLQSSDSWILKYHVYKSTLIGTCALFDIFMVESVSQMRPVETFFCGFRDFPPGLGEPNFEMIVEKSQVFCSKKLAPASWRSWNSSPPQNLDPPMKTQNTNLAVCFFLKKSPNPWWTLSSSFFVWRFRSLRLKLLPLLFSWAYHSVPVPWPTSLVLSAKIKWPGTTIPSYNHLVEFFPELTGYDFWMVYKKWWAKEMLQENSQNTLQKPSKTLSIWKSSIFQNLQRTRNSESTGSFLCLSILSPWIFATSPLVTSFREGPVGPSLHLQPRAWVLRPCGGSVRAEKLRLKGRG